MGKYFIITFCVLVMMGLAVCLGNKTYVQAKEKPLIIVLDPGHGGSQSGAARDNETIEEKDLNLKIARYLKKELESYKKVKVYLTRTGDKDVELADRIKFAVRKKADVLISLHNNAAGECAAYDRGCTVLAAKAGYKDKLALEGQKLSCNILKELSGLGITDQGILLRDSEANERYPNRVLADYYAIIRGGVENDMLAVLVEHAFIDSDSDYKNYLSSDKKLKKLARADATGIARYYQLIKKNQVHSSDTKKSKPEESGTEKAGSGKLSTEKTDIEKSSLEKSGTEKTNIEKSSLEKSGTEKTDIEKSSLEKSNTEKANTGQSNTEKIGIEKLDMGKCALEPLTNYKEKLVHAVDGNAKHNKISYKIYYSTDKEAIPDRKTMEVFQAITESVNEMGITDLQGHTKIK